METGDFFMELLLTLIGGLFILIGTLITFKIESEKFIDFTVATAFSVLMSLILFELIPEVTHHLELYEIFIYIIVGIIILKLLDLLVPHHSHDHKHDKKHHNTLNHIVIVSSFALCLHNIIEGMTIYAVSKNSLHSGILMIIGVGIHNIPMGMIIGAGIESKSKKIILSTIVSLSTFIGGLFMILFSNFLSSYTDILLAITLGMIIYITLFELLPKLVCSKHKKEIFKGSILGFIVFLITLLFGGHNH